MQVESDSVSLVSDESAAAHATPFVEVFEVCVEVSTGLSFVSSELPLLAISQKGLTHKLRHLSPRGSLTPPGKMCCSAPFHLRSYLKPCSS